MLLKKFIISLSTCFPCCLSNDHLLSPGHSNHPSTCSIPRATCCCGWIQPLRSLPLHLVWKKSPGRLSETRKSHFFFEKEQASFLFLPASPAAAAPVRPALGFGCWWVARDPAGEPQLRPKLFSAETTEARTSVTETGLVASDEYATAVSQTDPPA